MNWDLLWKELFQKIRIYYTNDIIDIVYITGLLKSIDNYLTNPLSKLTDKSLGINIMIKILCKGCNKEYNFFIINDNSTIRQIIKKFLVYNVDININPIFNNIIHTSISERALLIDLLSADFNISEVCKIYCDNIQTSNYEIKKILDSSKYLYYMFPSQESIMIYNINNIILTNRAFEFFIKQTTELYYNNNYNNNNSSNNIISTILVFKNLGIVVNLQIFMYLFYTMSNHINNPNFTTPNRKLYLIISLLIDLITTHFIINFDILIIYNWFDIIASENNDYLCNIKYHSKFLLQNYHNINDNIDFSQRLPKSKFFRDSKPYNEKHLVDFFNIHPFNKNLQEDCIFTNWTNLFDTYIWYYLLQLDEDLNCYCKRTCPECDMSWKLEYNLKKLIPKFDLLFTTIVNDNNEQKNMIKSNIYPLFTEMLERGTEELNAQNGLDTFMIFYINNSNILASFNYTFIKIIINLFINYGATPNMNIIFDTILNDNNNFRNKYDIHDYNRNAKYIENAMLIDILLPYYDKYITNNRSLFISIYNSKNWNIGLDNPISKIINDYDKFEFDWSQIIANNNNNILQSKNIDDILKNDFLTIKLMGIKFYSKYLLDTYPNSNDDRSFINLYN